MQLLKNMKISARLMGAFLLVVVLLVMVGLTGIVSLGMVNQEDQELYEENTLPMTCLAKLYDALASQRVCANNMVIFYSADAVFAAEEKEALAKKESNFDEFLESYHTTIVEEEEMTLYDNIVALYNADFKEAKEEVCRAFESGNIAAMTSAVKRMDSSGSDISDVIDQAFEHNRTFAGEKVASNAALYKSSSVVIILIMAIAVVVSVLLAILISRLISNPVRRMLAVAKQVGQTGSLEFSDQVVQDVRADARNKDEVGQMAAAFTEMMDGMIAKSKTLEVVAAGDLTTDVTLAGEKDTLGNAISSMIENLNQMFGEIKTASTQVMTGSRQIAAGAQTLAQGSTEQAETIEELSASINEIAEKTGQNAQMADQAANLSENIRSSAEKGSDQMERMVTAVREINEASQNIGKVIRVIDDIAFQTNILALNAAVEAARAGQNGKGFAVVAEEVRNLASRSAEAAKDTTVLIDTSIEKASLGMQIAEKTAESLREIVSGIHESTAIVKEIAAASEEQAAFVQVIHDGIDQVTQVVQQNSATAEQSAASSEEMNSQSEILAQMVARFRLRKEGGRSLPPASAWTGGFPGHMEIQQISSLVM